MVKGEKIHQEKLREIAIRTIDKNKAVFERLAEI